METLGALYRCYDSEDRLLYVGISSNALRRLSEHNHRAGWIDRCVRVMIERHPTDELKALERQVILAERPEHNKFETTECDYA